MVGCTIPFCNNSSEKGYIMKILPRDEERRAQWINTINTKYKWTASKNSCVCEMHFQPEMWEQRSDNKKKLRHNAVPTIFEYYPKKQIVIQSKMSIINQTADIIEEQQPVHEEEHIVNDKQKVINENIEPAPTTASTSDTASIPGDNDTKEKIKNEKLEERNKKLQLYLILMHKRNRVLRSRIQTLEGNIKNNKYKKVLKEVFNEDQIKALSTKRRTNSWSNETIQRAVRLRFMCGTKGYEELLQQKIPLPSLRTLQRKFEI